MASDEHDVERLISAKGIFERVSQRLAIFVAVSVLLHGALLLAWKSSAPGSFEQVQTTLTVDLVLTDPRPTNAATRIAQSKPKRRQQPAQPRQITEAPTGGRASVRQVAERKPATTLRTPRPVGPDSQRPPAIIAATESADVDPEDGSKATENMDEADRPSASVQAKAQTLLLNDLARYFTYPPLARRRGWQGMVLLSVTLKPDGMLEGVQVSQSSGYDVLDRSAIDTLRRVGQIADAKQWLQGQGLEMSLPVVYRLTD